MKVTTFGSLCRRVFMFFLMRLASPLDKKYFSIYILIIFSHRYLCTHFTQYVAFKKRLTLVGQLKPMANSFQIVAILQAIKNIFAVCNESLNLNKGTETFWNWISLNAYYHKIWQKVSCSENERPKIIYQCCVIKS